MNARPLVVSVIGLALAGCSSRARNNDGPGHDYCPGRSRSCRAGHHGRAGCSA